MSEGRVGIRCVFCRDLPKSERASQASKLYILMCGVDVYYAYLVLCLALI